MKTLLILAAAALAAPAFGAYADNIVPTGKAAERFAAIPQDYTTYGRTVGEGPVDENGLAGEWLLATIDGKNVVEEEDVPYINFDSQDHRFYASNGCNVVNGSYRLNGKEISFGGVAATMKYCADAAYEMAFNKAVNDESVLLTTPVYRIGQDAFLTLTDRAGKPVMTLRKKNMNFLNGNWQITMADGMTINDEEATVFFDIPELKVHGNSGCNYFNGTLYINPQQPGAIDISNIGLTRRACPNSEQERAITVALEVAHTAAAGHEPDTVALINKEGKTVMTLKRAPVVEEE